jgi:hypothetical protein
MALAAAGVVVAVASRQRRERREVNRGHRATRCVTLSKTSSRVRPSLCPSNTHAIIIW